jgi:hypothetical protein
MADRTTRGAARLAALIALPIAVLAGFIAFRSLAGLSSTAPSAAPTSASPGPRSTAPVPMAAPALAEAPATACRALLAQLPDQLRDLARRPVTAGPEQNAAYGDPAITLSCGVPPPSLPPTAEVYVESGVCWYPQQGKHDSAWSTLDRQVPVTVTVPGSYDEPGQWVNEFSAPVAAALRSVADLPAGCQNPN